MIKLILTSKYEITGLLNTIYNCSNLYLGYIKDLGYILIQENDNAIKVKCIKSDNTEILEDNYHLDTEEIKELMDFIKPQLSDDMKDKHKDDTALDIVGDLIEDLSDKYNSKFYIKAKDIANPRIKEFVIDPVDRFNFYLNYGEVMDKENYLKNQKELYQALEDTLQQTVTLFNKNKGITGLDKKGNESPLITETKFIKILNNIISDSFGNPLLNLKFGNGKEKLNTIEAIDYLTDEFKIKGVYENTEETIYYFNDDLNYFEILNEKILKNLIISRLGIKLLRSDYNKIYHSFETSNQIDDNILYFKNILFDMNTMEELKGDYRRSDYLSRTLIGYEDNKNQIQLIDYDTNLEHLDLYEDNENKTYIEQTLRKILIPKNDPKDKRMFIDFLQRFGSCILGRNKYKVITLYKGDGNNGKGILKLLNELVYNNGAYSLTPGDFEDKFGAKGFLNKKVCLIDEIGENDFKYLIPTLKRISSPQPNIQQRKIQSDEYYKLNKFPMLIMFANLIFTIDFSEKALFDRLDILELPNTFVTEKELNKKTNTYLVDRNTEIKVKNDTDGLSWLITASIQAFKNMEEANNEFLLRQTAEETMDIVSDVDYLTKFIVLYTYENENLIPSEFTTVEEIYQQYIQYLELQGKTDTDTETTIKRRIGTTIKQIYDIKGKVSDSDMYHKQDNVKASYRIELKSFEELNNEFKQVYVINEDTYIDNNTPISDDHKLIYKKIQKGVNTINKLEKEFPGFNVNRMIKELSNLNLIIKTNDTTIDT